MLTETPRDFMRPIKYGERGSKTKKYWEQIGRNGTKQDDLLEIQRFCYLFCYPKNDPKKYFYIDTKIFESAA